MADIARTEYLTVKEVADLLGVLPSWVYDNHRTLGLPSVKFRGLLRFPRVTVLEWAAGSLRGAA